LRQRLAVAATVDDVDRVAGRIVASTGAGIAELLTTGLPSAPKYATACLGSTPQNAYAITRLCSS
jgi:hypothetical protein